MSGARAPGQSNEKFDFEKETQRRLYKKSELLFLYQGLRNFIDGAYHQEEKKPAPRLLSDLSKFNLNLSGQTISGPTILIIKPETILPYDEKSLRDAYEALQKDPTNIALQDQLKRNISRFDDLNQALELWLKEKSPDILELMIKFPFGQMAKEHTKDFFDKGKFYHAFAPTLDEKQDQKTFNQKLIAHLQKAKAFLEKSIAAEEKIKDQKFSDITSALPEQKEKLSTRFSKEFKTITHIKEKLSNPETKLKLEQSALFQKKKLAHARAQLAKLKSEQKDYENTHTLHERKNK